MEFLWAEDASEATVALRDSPALIEAAQKHCKSTLNYPMWNTQWRDMPAGVPHLNFGDRTPPKEYKDLLESAEPPAPYEAQRADSDGVSGGTTPAALVSRALHSHHQLRACSIPHVAPVWKLY